MSYMKGKSSINIGIICVTVLVVLSVLGIGYSTWINGINMETVISTGDIAPVFSSEPIVTETNTRSKPDDAGPASAILSPDQKTMYVSILGAYPGYAVDIGYTVSNMGTIPISCKIRGKAPKPIVVNFSDFDGVLNPRGDSKSGTIGISVPKGVKEKTDYSFAINLEFDQYNLENQ